MDYLEDKSFTLGFRETLALSGNEVVCVLIITTLLVFATAFIRVGVEADTSSSTYPIVIEHYGFPFDAMRKNYVYTPGVIVFRGSITPTGFVKSTTEFVPFGILLNFLIYGALSFVIVKVSSKIIDEIEYRRYKE